MWTFTGQFRRPTRDETFRLRQYWSTGDRKYKKNNGSLHRICS